jgi:membrane protease YdiL (CAAX protease family)
MSRRSVLEIMAVVASVVVGRDLTVALDLALRERWSGYASLGVASIVAIWGVVLVAVAIIWPQSGRPRIRPPQPVWTMRNVVVVIGILVAIDWLYDFRLARVIAGQIPFHAPISWLSFVAIAIGGPVVEEWLFRGVLWDAIASRTRGLAATVAPIVITSLLFGIAHCRWMLEPTWRTPSGVSVMSHVAFGACIAVLRWRFRSIGPGMVAHGLWNALYPLTS